MSHDFDHELSRQLLRAILHPTRVRADSYPIQSEASNRGEIQFPALFGNETSG